MEGDNRKASVGEVSAQMAVLRVFDLIQTAEQNASAAAGNPVATGPFSQAIARLLVRPKETGRLSIAKFLALLLMLRRGF